MNKQYVQFEKKDGSLVHLPANMTISEIIGMVGITRIRMVNRNEPMAKNEYKAVAQKCEICGNQVVSLNKKRNCSQCSS
ncbi:MAG: hypothetical protein ACOCUT_00205 [bacterium]